MALLAATTLLWPGTALDRVWALNPRAYRELIPLAKPAGMGFSILAAILAAASIGWFARRVWAWWLAVFVIAAHVFSNIINLFRGHLLDGLIGAIIAGALLIYLFRPRTRLAFH